MGSLDRLSILRKRSGLTQSGLAERMGVEQPTVQRWETGKREPTLEQILRLAEILEVEPAALFDPLVAAAIGPRLYIKGVVAAGVWRTAMELASTDWQTFTGRADIVAKPEQRFGLRVVGDSMNEIYPDGTILECVSVFDERTEIAPGRRVIVMRTNTGGEREATVKELVEQDSELWLVPRSTNPIHQPIRLAHPDLDIVEVQITAIVVASIRPE